MSTSKATHVQDTSILERRLRPIYDWLDNGVNKKALQECEKVLKKTPNLQCAKALKAIALLRLGKSQESKSVLDSLVNECPTDDATLQAISICYRESNELENICKLYENALKADKTNEELHTHLFMSYVRVNNFKEQQKAAMALYKLKPRPPYYTWAVMSNVLQATRSADAKDPQKKVLLLNLAERMMVKLLDNQEKVEGEHEGHLYVYVLELLGKFEEILKFLETPLGVKLIKGAIQFDRLKFLIKLKRWRKVNVYCKQVLNESIDKWNVWMEYLNSVFELMKIDGEKGDLKVEKENLKVEKENLKVEKEDLKVEKEDLKVEKDDFNTKKDNLKVKDGEIFENGTGSGDETSELGGNSTGNGLNEVSVDDTPEKAHEFICSLIENGINGYGQRGPYLARIELCQRLTRLSQPSNNQTNFEITSNVITDLLGEPAQLFVEYFRLFGHKPCCVSDLRGYLNILEPRERMKLCENLLRDLNIEPNTVPNSLDKMQRHISAIQLSKLSGAYEALSIEDLYETANILATHYTLGYEKYGKDLLVTDQGPSDPYGLIAAHVLYSVAIKTQSSEPLIAALAILENLLRNSKSCFHAKLLCVKFYHALGGATGAQSAYETLDLKHIQLDSLGYIHCSRLATTGLLSLASSLYDTTIKFFVTNYRDSSDHLTFAYKYGSFLKIDEFMDFREKLYNSLHYTQTVTDRIALNLMQCISLDALTEADLTIKDGNIDWDAACDNSDLSVYQCWDPPRVENPPENWEIIKIHTKQNLIFAQLRSFMLKNFLIAFKLVRNRETDENLKDLTKSLIDYEKLTKKVLKTNEYQQKNLTENFPSLPLPSRLHLFLKVPYLNVLKNYFEVFINFFSPKDIDNTLESIKMENKAILITVKNLIISQIKSKDRFFNRYKTLELLTNFVELLSLTSFILILCNETLRVKNLKKSKKIKDKEVLNGLISDKLGVLNETISILDELLTFKESFDCDSVEKRLETLQIDKSVLTGVFNELNLSLIGGLKDLKAVLGGKMKVLGSFV